MKIYLIIITIFFILVVVFAGYSYWQYSKNIKQYQEISDQLDICLKEKSIIEAELSEVERQLNAISKTTAVLRESIESFIIPGDLKVLSIGSKESLEIEKRINEIEDKTDRILADDHWNDFKSSRLFNSFFSFLRDLINNLERISANKEPIK
ncbi:hypothetical protein JW698_00625 [Candidatus Wolfebacteria bacterium]|nr:hypothetical protein [Candidatus Wolfebacteria bacterium]